MGEFSNEGEVAKPSSGSPPNDIPSLTSLRGLLACWVVVYHFRSDLELLFPWSEALAPVLGLGHMAVPAFFMLSGFVLSHNYGSRFERLRRSEVIRFLYLRLARVYPVHFVTLLVVLGMVGVSDLLGYQLTYSGYTTRDFVLNVLLVQTWVPDFQLNWNYPSWSISSEWFAYLFFPFAVVGVLCRLTTRFRAITFVLLALLGSVGVMVFWRPLPFYELVLVIPTFLGGAAVYWIVRNRMPSASVKSRRWLPEVLVVVLCATCYMPSTLMVTGTLLCGFFLLIASLGWLGVSCQAWWSSRPLVYLGEISYSLYMTHTLAQKVLYRLLPSSRFDTSDFAVRLCVLIGYLLLVMAFTLATYYLVESPCRDLFKRILRRPVLAAN